ncbi:streptophobe family protein [Streptomyces netropsis]
MSSQPPRSAPGRALGEVRAWRDALATVAAGIVALFVVAALGLWAAGAATLPGGAFPHVVAATVVTAVGGTVRLSGGAGPIAQSGGGLNVVPLSVTLAGALAIAVVFLLPLRHHAVVSGPQLLARIARTAVLWLLALLIVALGAKHTFRISLGDEALDDIGDLLGATPSVGFRAAVGSTLAFGLLWLLVLLAVASAVSRKTPLPPRLLPFQDSVRPAAFAMLVVLLAYVVLGLAIGVVMLFTRGQPDRTAAVLLLGLPNLVWLAFGVGLGGAWEGRVPDPIGLPMPRALVTVLRQRDGEATGAVDLGSLAEQDGRAWLLVVVAAVALLAAGLLMAVRSPADTRLWQHAVRLGIAVAITLLVVGLLTRVSARFGLSLFGIGDLDAFGGEVLLRPRLWLLVGVGLLWGLIAGFLGGLFTSRVRRRGEVTPDADGR